MPVIVKWKYIRPLLQALAAAEQQGLTDEQIVARVNAPTQAGTRWRTLSRTEVLDCLSADTQKRLRAAVLAENARAIQIMNYIQAADEGMQFSLAPGSKFREAAEALVPGSITAAEAQALLAAATEPNMTGASQGEGLGIGLVYQENLAQLRAYRDLSEQEIREELAGILLIRCVRQIRAAGLTAEQYIAEEPATGQTLNRWQLRLQTVAEYTGVSDEARLRALLDELLAEAERLAQGMVS